VGGAATFDAGSANDITLTNAGNNFSSVGITSGNNVSLTDTNALVLNASTISGTLGVTASGAITQNGVLAVTGASTFAAGSANDITLTNAGNNFSSVGITSGNNVSLTDTNALALNASTIGSSLSATAGGDITLNGLVNAGTGSITLKSGGAIINGMSSATSIMAASLAAEAVSGIGSSDPLMTKVNKLAALNTTSNNVRIDNTGVLSVTALSNGGTGNVVLQNIGAITTDVSTLTSSGGSVSITAHSPLTIGTGGVAAAGSISLVAAASSGGSDNLTINGNIASTSGSIILTAGGSIALAPGVALSAPNGTITLSDNLNGPAAGDLSVVGNNTATDNTVSSLITAMGEITSVNASDDEEERKKKSKEGGEQKTDDKKMDDDKKYCN
jgi:hypothetical protein